MSLFCALILLFLFTSFESKARFNEELINDARRSIQMKGQDRNIASAVLIINELKKKLNQTKPDIQDAYDLADTITDIIAYGRGVGGLRKTNHPQAFMNEQERKIAIAALREATNQIKSRHGLTSDHVSVWLNELAQRNSSEEAHRNHMAVFSVMTLTLFNEIGLPPILNYARTGFLEKEVLNHLRQDKDQRTSWLGEKLSDVWFWYHVIGSRKAKLIDPTASDVSSTIYRLGVNNTLEILSGAEEEKFFNWLAEMATTQYKADSAERDSQGRKVKGVLLQNYNGLSAGESQNNRGWVGFYDKARPFSFFQNTNSNTVSFWAPIIDQTGKAWNIDTADIGVNFKQTRDKDGQSIYFYLFGNSEAYFQLHKAFAANGQDETSKKAFIKQILAAGKSGGRKSADDARSFWNTNKANDNWETKRKITPRNELYDELTNPYPDDDLKGRVSGEGYKDSVMYKALFLKFNAHPALAAIAVTTMGIGKIEHTGDGVGIGKRDLYWGDGLADGELEGVIPGATLGINTLGRYVTAFAEMLFARPDLIAPCSLDEFDRDLVAIRAGEDGTLDALKRIKLYRYLEYLRCALAEAHQQKKPLGNLLRNDVNPAQMEAEIARLERIFPNQKLPVPATIVANPQASAAAVSVVAKGKYDNGMRWQDLQLPDGKIQRQEHRRDEGWVNAFSR
jgi:hypothetical protein